MAITPVILCGGSGTRLWPLSRQDFAKQHVPLFAGVSPFQQTLLRTAERAGFARPMVLVGQGGRFMAADQALRCGVEIDIVVEPEGRDTLAAIAAAAEIVARRDPAAVLAIMPSDHLIPDAEAFADALARAGEGAASGAFVTLGMTPREPAEGYGYIRPGVAAGEGRRRVAAFVEKPNAERAAMLIAEGCLWNLGVFCLAAGAAKAEIARLAPATAEAVVAAVDEATVDLGALRLGPAFATATKMSFDYGVMEKTDRAEVVEVDFDWSDIGDWRELWRASARDASGNAVTGDAIVTDGANNFVHADGRLVCAMGVSGLAIVDTPDALLVAPLDRSQDVKTLVGRLAASGRGETVQAARVHRPWGWYQVMDRGERFRVKRIQVTPGKQLSLQKHHHRAEHWVVVKGTAEVTRDGETLIVRENESVYLPLGCVHRLANPGRIPVEIIEVQTGAYLEEDDIVRLDDDFGRR